MTDELPAKAWEAIEKGPQFVDVGENSHGIETYTMFARRIARLAIEEATGDLREELSHVLVDWNALVAAIGAPTNGGAIGYARELRGRLERAQADLALYVQVSSVLDGMTGRAPTSAEWEQIKELAKQVKGGIMLDLAIHEAKEAQ